MSKLVCELLGKRHDRTAFTCGVLELDEYLRQRASQDMRRRVAAVFVMVPEDDPSRIAGYYTLSSASIVVDDLPEDIVKRLPRYPAVPAVLIGRLARDVRFSGVGKLLLLDALSRSFQHSDEVAAAVVLVDAKNEQAREFYARYGFAQVEQTPNRMFLPMKTVEKLLKSTH
jgi:ribosomal protein S18 acetylase RimI-like enzyme